MRRLVFTAAVALFAFTIGVGAFLLWRSSQTLPYCEVARNGEWYHNKIIRVRATLIFGSGGMYVYEDCDPVEAFASMVELDGTISARGHNYVNEVLVTGNRAPVRKVDAVIEGRFDAKASTGCWRPKYHIAATKIQLLSAVTDYHPTSADETPLRARH
jgi:hypothetical protein